MKRVRVLSAATALTLVMGMLAAAQAGAIPQRHATVIRVKPQPVGVHRMGAVNVVQLARLAATRHVAHTPPAISGALARRFLRLTSRMPGSHAGTPTSLTNPSPAHWKISPHTTKSFHGFRGISAPDSFAANPATQDVEPPDQGLCAGNGYVIDAVNLAVQIYSTSGTALLQSPVSLSAVFGQPPAFVNPSGSIVSDPKCLYDPTNGLWYMTVLESDLMSQSTVMLAVSQTSNPLQGWSVYSIDVTNNTGGDPHLNCPCLGDQPLLGTDANGIYISTNEFTLGSTAHFFNGSQIYAISKAWLLHGSGPIGFSYSLFCDPAIPTPSWTNTCGLDPSLGVDNPNLNNQVFSMQPTTTASGVGATANDGTEYFLGSTDYVGAPGDLVDSVLTGAITDTNGLNADPPTIGTLQLTQIPSETYGFPPNVTQRSGPMPLGTSVGLTSLSPILTNDDRMNQTVLARGMIWGAVNTVVGAAGTQTGIAWFAVAPTWSGSTLSGATVARQGYVATSANVWFPSLAIAPNGRMVMAMSLGGGAYYPSGAYAVDVPLNGKPGTIYDYAKGVAPEDGFTCYANLSTPPAPPQFVNTPCRWGDYSAATAMTNGTVWFADEWIPAVVDVAGGHIANWGTALGSVRP